MVTEESIVAANALQHQEQPKHKCFVRATLHHLNGNTSQIIMTLPQYSFWSEFLESGMNAMRDYVNQMTRHFIKISHFFVEMGSIKPDGSFYPLYLPMRHDIPCNKVYSGDRDGWISPEDHPRHPMHNYRGSSKTLGELAKIVSERNEAIYKDVDEKTTQCGIPYYSRGFYFDDRDLPSGSFEEGGVEYLVVYSFTKSISRGGQSCA